MIRGWGNHALPVACTTGVFSGHLLHQLPPGWVTMSALAAGLLLLFTARGKLLAAWLLALGWTLLNFSQQVDQRLDSQLINQSLMVEGRVIDLPELYPEYTRFRFRPLTRHTDHHLPDTLLVYWYRDRLDVQAGQIWRLEVQLKPPWGRINFHGPDREKWLFAQRVGALATVKNGQMIAQPAIGSAPVQQVRSHLREQIGRILEGRRSEPVIRALAVADRSGLSNPDQDLLVATGTSHLLAISGLHIGLAAVAGNWLARLLLFLMPRFSRTILGFRLSMLVGILAAVSYAALAGWGVSTQRALIMITVLMTALMASRTIDPLRSFLLALGLVLIVNPLAPLGAGFWFSFIAVGALIVIFTPRRGKLATWKTMLLAQAGIMVAMIPLSISWFQIFSPVGFVANLIAIPIVSLVVVPLTLAGMVLLPLSTLLADPIIGLAGASVSGLLHLLQTLATLQGSLPQWAEPGTMTVILATMGGFLLLLPRGLPHRWLALFLFLPLFLPPASRSSTTTFQVDVLDVGQGTSVLISTAHHSLLYDSGPGDGEGRDLVRSAILPTLRALAPAGPEVIVISHGDLDHAGGIRSLAAQFNDARWISSLSIPASDSESTYALAGIRSNRLCETELGWSWDTYAFQVLHPSSALPYRGNDSSCVISIRGQRFSMLLPGDISSSVERRLLLDGLQPHRMLLVPHHGSKTSSSPEFLDRTQTEIAIATAGLGNRFGFPRPEVRERFRSTGTSFLSTSDCGGIRAEVDGNGIMRIQSARRVRQRIWRWPAAGDCP